jgi:hypothetical protein
MRALESFTVSAITLHLVEDPEPYEKVPKVGVVARAKVNISGNQSDVSIESYGVWGIECPDLVAGRPVPEGSWVIGDYGNDQIEEVRSAIRTMFPNEGRTER